MQWLEEGVSLFRGVDLTTPYVPSARTACRPMPNTIERQIAECAHCNAHLVTFEWGKGDHAETLANELRGVAHLHLLSTIVAMGLRRVR